MQPQLGTNMQMAGQPMTMNPMPQNMQYSGGMSMGQPQIVSQGMPTNMMMGGAQTMPTSYAGLNAYPQNCVPGACGQIGNAGMPNYLQSKGGYSSFPQIPGAQVVGQPKLISSQVISSTGGYSQPGVFPQVQGAQVYSGGAYTSSQPMYGQPQMIGQPQIVGQQPMMNQGYNAFPQQMGGQPQIMQGGPQMMQGNYPQVPMKIT